MSAFRPLPKAQGLATEHFGERKFPKNDTKLICQRFPSDWEPKIDLAAISRRLRARNWIKNDSGTITERLGAQIWSKNDLAAISRGLKAPKWNKSDLITRFWGVVSLVLTLKAVWRFQRPRNTQLNVLRSEFSLKISKRAQNWSKIDLAANSGRLRAQNSTKNAVIFRGFGSPFSIQYDQLQINSLAIFEKKNFFVQKMLRTAKKNFLHWLQGMRVQTFSPRRISLVQH